MEKFKRCDNCVSAPAICGDNRLLAVIRKIFCHPVVVSLINGQRQLVKIEILIWEQINTFAPAIDTPTDAWRCCCYTKDPLWYSSHLEKPQQQQKTHLIYILITLKYPHLMPKQQTHLTVECLTFFCVCCVQEIIHSFDASFPFGWTVKTATKRLSVSIDPTFNCLSITFDCCCSRASIKVAKHVRANEVVIFRIQHICAVDMDTLVCMTQCSMNTVSIEFMLKALAVAI